MGRLRPGSLEPGLAWPRLALPPSLARGEACVPCSEFTARTVGPALQNLSHHLEGQEDMCGRTAPKLVNDLDLVVIDPNGKQYNGNDIIAPYNDQWDRLNNVERVEIKTPVRGMHTVEIRGFNVPIGTQDFALVASRGSVDAKVAVQGTPQVGKPVKFTIDDPCHPGEIYFVLMGMSGTSPGLPVGDGRTVPVNYDMVLAASLLQPTSIGLVNASGKLDVNGNLLSAE